MRVEGAFMALIIVLCDVEKC